MGEHQALSEKTKPKNKFHLFRSCCGGIKDTPISLHFHVLQLVESLPFNIHEAYKSHPFRVEPPHVGHCREYTHVGFIA